METRSQTPSDDAQGLWFDEWSSPVSFDLLTNEHTTSVWKPAHLLGLRQASRTPQLENHAVEMQMTWDDEESTTRMWNLAHVAGAGFFTPNQSAPNDVDPRFASQASTQRIGVAPAVARRKRATTQPPPPPAKRTGPQRAVVAAAAQPLASGTARQRPARQTLPGINPASATTTGARPASRTTQRARPVVTLADSAHARRAGSQPDLASTQSLNWPWTIASATGLFAAVLTGLVILPIGTTGVSVDGGQPIDAPAVRTATPEPLLEPTADAPQAAATAAVPELQERARELEQPASAAAAPAETKVSKRARTHEAVHEPVTTPRATEPRAAAARPSLPQAAVEPRAESAVADTGDRKHEPGLLRINSRPWAQVFIDGKPRGATPQTGLPVNPGHHTVQLVNTPMGMSKTFPLDVRSGEIVTKVVNLIE